MCSGRNNGSITWIILIIIALYVFGAFGSDGGCGCGCGCDNVFPANDGGCGCGCR